MLSRHFYYFLFFFLFGGDLISQTYNFEQISLEHGLPQAQINCLKEDSRGYLWIGTQGGGIAQYDGINFKVFDETSGLPGSIVNAVEEDNNGNIWVGTTWGGVSRYDGKGFSTFTSEDGLMGNGVKALCCDKYNKMYVATAGGLNIIQNKVVLSIKQDVFNGKNSIKKYCGTTNRIFGSLPIKNCIYIIITSGSISAGSLK